VTRGNVSVRLVAYLRKGSYEKGTVSTGKESLYPSRENYLCVPEKKEHVSTSTICSKREGALTVKGGSKKKLRDDRVRLPIREKKRLLS